jgi:type II protein arginine methyltransferase
VPLAALATLDDLSVVPPDEDAPTPALRLVSVVEDRGFEKLCLPLTTEKWKSRWRGMCVMPDNQELERGSQEQQEILRRAEDWRAHPRFLKDEVTITRLGMLLFLPQTMEINKYIRRGRRTDHLGLRMA